MNKTITVKKDVWNKLTKLKIDGGFETISDTIKNLIKKKEAKK